MPVGDDPWLSGPGGTGFPTTRWSVVLGVNGGSEEARYALETLCRTYWLPVYSLIRERGSDPESARDLTQEFFSRLLSRDGVASARRELGRFRSYLSRSVKNFLSDEWDRSRARKRGGGEPLLSLDADDGEGRHLEVPHDVTPDRLFDLQWARELVRLAHERLRTEFAEEGRVAWWEVLHRVGDPDAPSLGEEANRLGLPLNTLKSHLRRARQRQAAILRQLVADTVSTPVDVDAELRHLLAVLAE